MLAREHEESGEFSSEGSGPSSEALTGLQVIFLEQAARELEMATAIRGGVRQERVFRG